MKQKQSTMKTVQILFNTNEYELTFEPEDCKEYNKFISLVRQKLNIRNNDTLLKIMSLNTQVEYTLLNEQNFISILEEKINDDCLKLFVTEEQKRPEDDDEDFEIENHNNDKEEEEEETKNKQKEDDYNNKARLDTFSSLNNSNEGLYFNGDLVENGTNIKSEDNPQNIKINNMPEEVLDSNNNNLYYHEEFKYKGSLEPPDDQPNFTDYYNEQKKTLAESEKKEGGNFLTNEYKIKSEKNELIGNSQDGLVNEEKENEEENVFKDEKCDICEKTMTKIKYICCICEKCSMCEFCEVEHPHPTFKYKTKFLSNLDDTFQFLKSKHDIPPPQSTSKFLGKVFASDIELLIEPQIDYELSLLTNTTVNIPFLIINHSKYDISSDDFIIFVKNFKKTKVLFDDKFKFKVKAKNSISLDFEFSTTVPCHEQILFEIYSYKFKVKDNKKRTCLISLDVSDDKEEQQLNEKLRYYGKIYLLKKEHKKVIWHVINENISTKSPMEIYEILKSYDWNLQKAKNQLMRP